VNGLFRLDPFNYCDASRVVGVCTNATGTQVVVLLEGGHSLCLAQNFDSQERARGALDILVSRLDKVRKRLDEADTGTPPEPSP
jgi:hypothetical protein